MFPCNFNEENPQVEGLNGILDVYKTAIKRVQLFGPTNFAPIIRQVASFAKSGQECREGKKYFVLLILTDGIITDMQETKRAIVENSGFPFSIIIVGVGGADFDDMCELDAKETLLTCQVLMLGNIHNFTSG